MFFKNQKTKKMGYHDYYLQLSNKELEGEYIEVEKDFRKQGVGELLRLASIIEMNANNLDKMTLFSFAEAVKFHALYGFYPNAKSSETITSILTEIIEQNKFQDLTCIASNMLDNINARGLKFLKPETQQKFNDFLAGFIARCPASDVPVLSKGINMILTKEKIKSNADFYNNLFEKHKINFQI